MPRKIPRSFLLPLLWAFMAIPAEAGAGKTITVIVKQTSIRKDRQFFAPTVARAGFKAKLNVIKKENDWFKVSYRGKKGWVHVSAVSSKAGGGKTGISSFFGKKEDPSKVSQEEVALAGKGFNSKVESEYQRKNPELNFAAVDRMEKITVPEQKVAGFVKAGNLHPTELEQ